MLGGKSRDEISILDPAVLGLREAEGLTLQYLGPPHGHYGATGRGLRDEPRGLQLRCNKISTSRRETIRDNEFSEIFTGRQDLVLSQLYG